MTNIESDNVYRVLKTVTRSSLSRRSEITAEYSYHEPSKTIMFRLVENTGSGHFSSAYIKLDDILRCLETAMEPFSLNIFRSLYPGLSCNNYGFVGTVLLHAGALKLEKRRYVRGDIKAFRNEIQQTLPSKPSKQGPAMKKSRKQVTPPQEPEVQPC